MHHLATIHNVTDDDDRQTDDTRNSVPIARPLVRSAKNCQMCNRLYTQLRCSVDWWCF